MCNQGFVTLNYLLNHCSTLKLIAFLKCTFDPLESQYWRGHIYEKSSLINKFVMFFLDHLRSYFITGPPCCYRLPTMKSKSNMHISQDCMNSTLLFYGLVYTAQLSKCETRAFLIKHLHSFLKYFETIIVHQSFLLLFKANH